MVQLPEVHPRTVQQTELYPWGQNPDTKSRGTRDNAVRLRHVRHVERARVPLRHAESSPPPGLAASVGEGTTEPTTRFPISAASWRQEMRASRWLCAGGRSCLLDFMARMEDPRLPKCMLFGWLMGGVGCEGGRGKEWMECFLDDLT